MIIFKQKGDFSKTFDFLKKVSEKDMTRILEKYGEIGVLALSQATPKDTGKTASSWGYEIQKNGNKTTISWTNSNVTENGLSIAILIQYGHGTRGGAYVQGRDYINPAIQPILDTIAENVWKEVSVL